MKDKSGIGTFVSDDYEMATDSLDLFSLPPVEHAQIRGVTQSYYMHAAINDEGPYEIVVPNDSHQFTQLDTMRLVGCFEVQKADGSAFVADDKVSVVNTAPQTLFKQIECLLNGCCVNDISTSSYPFKSYLENHFSFDEDIKNTTLRATEMYYKDTDDGEPDTANLTAADTGFAKRKKLIIDKKKVYFVMKLHIDFLQSKKYLIPGVEIKLKFIRNEDSFTLFAPANTVGKIKMHSLELQVRKITCDPAYTAAVENGLSSKPALYPISHGKIKVWTMNSTIQSEHIPNIFRGRLPRSFIMWMIPADAYNKYVNHNPFKFQHFDLSNFNVYVDGEPIHPKAITPKWDDASCLTVYTWYLNNIGLHSHVSNGITFEDFIGNSTIFAYDRTPDLCNSFTHHGSDNGNIDVSIAFKKPLAKNIVVMFYGVFDEVVSIDKDRNVTIIQ